MDRLPRPDDLPRERDDRGRSRGRPHPAVAAVRRTVEQSLLSLPGGSAVLVACSGGPDSLALAAAAGFLARRRGIRAGAAVVDHGLQPGSDLVCTATATTCKLLGLDPVLTRVVAVPVSGDGPEAGARSARYAALREMAGEAGASAVLLGHTRDDQAETVLLGLARGSGARSLAGMAPASGSDPAWLRPMLDLPRDRVHAAAEAALAELPTRPAGLPWHDPHNSDPKYSRSRLRARALPVLAETLGPGVVSGLARSAEQLRDDADLLDTLAADLLQRAVLPGRCLDIPVLAEAPRALRARALLAAAVRAGCPPGRVTSAHVRAMERLVTAWRGQGPVNLPEGVVVERRCGRLYLIDPAGPDRA